MKAKNEMFQPSHIRTKSAANNIATTDQLEPCIVTVICKSIGHHLQDNAARYAGLALARASLFILQ